MKLKVDPGVHPVVAKSNRPYGNTTVCGGGVETALNGTQAAREYEQVGPPPVKHAVAGPAPEAV